MRIRSWIPSVLFMTVLLAVGTFVRAQSTTGSQQGTVTVVQSGTQEPMLWVSKGTGAAEQGATVAFIGTEVGFESKVVKGSPFSAETVTDFSQTLSNGQNIYRKSTAALYRDSEGRTRREQTINAIGPYTSTGQGQKTIVINDPVAGVTYMLNPDDMTAMKVTLGSKAVTVYTTGKTGGVIGGVAGGVGGGGVAGGVKATSTGTVHTGGSTIDIITMQHASANKRTEQLGTEMMGGVQAEGTRTIETIPTGAIGNDSPIEIITEVWYSPELDIVVKKLHSDPRSGKNVYQLVNIRREEPSSSLFQVPPEYTIKDGLSHMSIIKKDDRR